MTIGRTEIVGEQLPSQKIETNKKLNIRLVESKKKSENLTK